MRNSPVDPAKVTRFWDAVAATSETFVSAMMDAGGQHQTEEFLGVATLLGEVHPDLLLVVGHAQAARPEVVISAGGVRDAFPAVQQIAQAAPASVTARYDVRAFRPRVPDPTGIRVRVKGEDVGPGDIRWDAKRHRGGRGGLGRCDLSLFLPGFIDALPADSTANRDAVEAVFLLLDHLVGEWAVEAQVGVIDWHSLRDSGGLPTLVSLPDYLDQISAE